MLADTESDSIDQLGEQFRELVANLESSLHLAGDPLEAPPSQEGNFPGFAADHYYILKEGNVTLTSKGRTICILEPGEMLLPEMVGIAQPDHAIAFTSTEGARLVAFPASVFIDEVLSKAETSRLWSSILITFGALMTTICADLAPMDVPEMGGCEMYGRGDVIIRQGDRADYVFNMRSGEAEVLVSGVNVGLIGQGEIFGAMAALTHSDRNATVQALGDCVVEKVPTDQFSELIRSNPGTIHGLLVDMANSIVNLNEQLVGLRGPQSPT